MLRGTGILNVNKTAVYGFIVQVEGCVRFKVWSSEWATAGVDYGEEVTVQLPGQSARGMVVSSVTPLPGDDSTWVIFSEPMRRRVKPPVAGTRARRS